MEGRIADREFACGTIQNDFVAGSRPVDYHVVAALRHGARSAADHVAVRDALATLATHADWSYRTEIAGVGQFNVIQIGAHGARGDRTAVDTADCDAGADLSATSRRGRRRCHQERKDCPGCM